MSKSKTPLSKAEEKELETAEREIKIAQDMLAKRDEVKAMGELPVFNYDPEAQTFGPKCLDKNLSDKAGASLHLLELYRVLNVNRPETATLLLNGMVNGQKVDDKLGEQVNGALAIAEQMEPRDPAETMLVMQMILSFQASTELLGFMRNTDSFARRDQYGRHAERLLRIYNQQMATLTKYRSGGKQSVEVKHVHVNEGGQAIIGDVHAN